MANKNYDYVGWATVYNKKCKDGRTILPGAFDHIEPGHRVPLVWSHKHNDPELCLGHAYLFPNENGVYAGIVLNDGKKAQAAKRSLESGDYDSLSIWADGLRERRGLVSHGDIQEVSLCLTGANPEAKIIFDPALAHANDGEVEFEAMTYYSNEELVEYDDSVNNPYLAHSADDEDEDDEDFDEYEGTENQNDDDEDDQDRYNRVISSLTPEQAAVVAEIIGGLLPDEDDGSSMEHSGYDDDEEYDYEDDDEDSDAYDENDDVYDDVDDDDADDDADLDDDELEHDYYTGEDTMYNVFETPVTTSR